MTKLTPANEILMSGIGEVIRTHVDAKLRPLQQKIEELEKRAVPKWQGTYREGEVYVEASLTTHGGSLWLAKRSTMNKPGHEDWVLVVKRGDHDQRTVTSNRGPR